MSDRDIIDSLSPFVEKALVVLERSPETEHVLSEFFFKDYDDEFYRDPDYSTRFIGKAREDDLDAIPAVRWLERHAETFIGKLYFNTDETEGGQETASLLIERDRVVICIELLDSNYLRIVSWHPERPSEIQKLIKTSGKGDDLSAHERLELARTPEKIVDLLELPEEHKEAIKTRAVLSVDKGVWTVELDPEIDILNLDPISSW